MRVGSTMNSDGDFPEDDKETYRKRNRWKIEDKDNYDTYTPAVSEEEFSTPISYTRDRKKQKPKRRNTVRSFFEKVGIFVLGCVVGAAVSLFIVGTSFGFAMFFPNNEQGPNISIYELERTLEASSELTITKVHYADFLVEGGSKSIPTPLGNWSLPFTENSILIAYRGTVGLGFDISNIDLKVDQEEKVITLRLPEIGILYSDFDNENTESYTLKNDVFSRDVDFDLSNEFIENIKATEENSILEDAVTMEEARTNAENVIRNTLTGWEDSSEYQVIFK